MVRNLCRAFSSVALLAFPIALAHAVDTHWLEEVHDCQTFEREVTAFTADVSAKSALTDEDYTAVERVVQEACGERFRDCDFAICRELAGGLEPYPTVIEALPSTEQGADQVREASSVASAVLPPSRPTVAADSVNPLAWLYEDMQCEDFLKEFRARYGKVGSYAELGERNKNELRIVLSVACSERFKECNFSSCRARTATRAATPSAGAEQQYKKKVEEKSARQKSKTSTRSRRDQQQGKEWKPVAAPR